jgi:hypothetical protein
MFMRVSVYILHGKYEIIKEDDMGSDGSMVQVLPSSDLNPVSLIMCPGGGSGDISNGGGSGC